MFSERIIIRRIIIKISLINLSNLITKLFLFLSGNKEELNRNKKIFN